jgi:hypothetical protein
MAQGYTGQGQPNTGEGYVTILGNQYSYITQGNWIVSYNVAYSMYAICLNNTNAQNDQVDYYIWLSKGTYTLDLFQTQGAMGICTYYLDSVSLGSLDWYNASSVYGVKKSIASISVTTSGRHTLSIKVTGHTTTANYYAYLHSLSMFRTA